MRLQAYRLLLDRGPDIACHVLEAVDLSRCKAVSHLHKESRGHRQGACINVRLRCRPAGCLWLHSCCQEP